MRFFVPGIPVGQPRQRHGVAFAGGKAFARNYIPSKHPIHDFKAAVKLAAMRCEEPKIGEGEPVSVSLLVLKPRPKGKTWKTKPMPREHSPGKPDFDNIAKAVCDALNGVVWHDDSQVCHAVVTKMLAAGDEPCGVHITIEAIDRKQPIR